MTTKNELVDEAEALGVEDADKLTKAELEDRISAQNPPELGPVVPEGSTPEPPKSSSSPTVGVQPQTADDIPEWGR